MNEDQSARQMHPLTHLSIAIVIAAAFIGFALPERSAGGRYEAFTLDGRIVRVDTGNGNIVACDWQRCVRVLGNGKWISKGNLTVLPATESDRPGKAAVEAAPEGAVRAMLGQSPQRTK